MKVTKVFKLLYRTANCNIEYLKINWTWKIRFKSYIRNNRPLKKKQIRKIQIHKIKNYANENWFLFSLILIIISSSDVSLVISSIPLSFLLVSSIRVLPVVLCRLSTWFWALPCGLFCTRGFHSIIRRVVFRCVPAPFQIADSVYHMRFVIFCCDSPWEFLPGAV